MENRFKTSLLDPATLSVTWELVPGRGAREKDQEKALTAAQQAAKGGKVHALTITDNPGGNPAILADYLGEEILKTGNRTPCPFYLQGQEPQPDRKRTLRPRSGGSAEPPGHERRLSRDRFSGKAQTGLRPRSGAQPSN